MGGDSALILRSQREASRHHTAVCFDSPRVCWCWRYVLLLIGLFPFLTWHTSQLCFIFKGIYFVLLLCYANKKKIHQMENNIHSHGPARFRKLLNSWFPIAVFFPSHLRATWWWCACLPSLPKKGCQEWPLFLRFCTLKCKFLIFCWIITKPLSIEAQPHQA